VWRWPDRRAIVLFIIRLKPGSGPQRSLPKELQRRLRAWAAADSPTPIPGLALALQRKADGPARDTATPIAPSVPIPAPTPSLQRSLPAL